MTSDQTLALAEGFLSNLQKTLLNERGDADFAYSNAVGRYRTSVVRQRLGVDLVFRIINTKVRTMDELGLPEHLKLLTRYQNGLILVTGSVGSGKSTTLAALVEQVNIERREHIITLEDPIEYVMEPKGCHITQREVHTHPPFAAGCSWHAFAKIRMSSWSEKCVIRNHPARDHGFRGDGAPRDGD